MQDTKDTEHKLLSQIHFMQQSLEITTEQTERERKFFLQVQLNLNGRLKEAKQRLERVSRDREKMISGLKTLFTTGNNNEVSAIEVDELIQKAAQSIHDHQDANRALTTCLETAQKEIRSVKEVRCDVAIVLKFDLTASLRRNTSPRSS
jgi:recombinational DNA repair ATPase RecF